MGLESFLVVSAVLFCVGLYGVLTKRNGITVLMSLELMFNAVNVAAVAMSRYVVPAGIAGDPAGAGERAVQFLLTGQVFSIFVITVAAAEVSLGLAIVMVLFRQKASVFVTDAAEMKN